MRNRQTDLCEAKVSLVYTVISRQPRLVNESYIRACLKRKREKEKEIVRIEDTV